MNDSHTTEVRGPSTAKTECRKAYVLAQSLRCAALHARLAACEIAVASPLRPAAQFTGSRPTVMSAVEADAVLPTVTAGSALIRWRKLLLRRRAELSVVYQSLEKLWTWYFLQHDPVTLRLQAARTEQGG